ncbi:CidA/LrgA family protein [Microbulbifer sp. Q7]|uniref:CidA/LrgA family protein n=1 Tax=Microbulbifer sp. Q7 TaxID=1785091 RepID=UPI00083485D8|nr:CidA/LrgA family protein [Microbulbifer sp. Q7]
MALAKKPLRWLLGAGLLLAFDLAGRGLTAVFALPVPGPVLGMLLLLLCLMLYGGVPRGLAEVAGQMLRFLVLILLPATVGIYFLRDLSGVDWVALVVAMVVGTLISFTLTALLLNSLIGRIGNTRGENTRVE